MSRCLPITRVAGDGLQRGEDQVVVEEPLEIRMRDAPVAVTMRTPGADLELAAGFALTEGIVDTADDLETVRPCGEASFGNVVEIVLASSIAERRVEAISRARRELFLSSSCGLCGKESVEKVRQRVAVLDLEWKIPAETLTRLPTQMVARQGAFAETGGLHAAALFSTDGSMLTLREDVGRHNAVDKVIGHELLVGRLPASATILLVSGRASFELVQKAGRAGIPMLCAISAPSSLAIELARDLEMTLVGFLRDDRMNVYHDPGRLVAAAGVAT